MGKKRIIKKTEDEILKETEATEKKIAQSVKPGELKNKNKLGQIQGSKAYIQSTYNNTIVTLTDVQGQVIAWSSSGAVGFKGPKKATPFAASKVVESLLEKVKGANIREISIFVKGVGSGRDPAIRAFVNHGIEISRIKDITPVPHNGCRPRKPRRV